MKKRSVFERIAAIPPVSWSVLFILAPLGFVLYFALTDRNGAFTLENLRALSSYSGTFFMSVGFSLIATAVCLLVGYPLAYAMSKTQERTRGVLMVLLMLPMWISLLIRTYSLMALLDNGGIVSGFLVKLGFEKLTFIGTEGAVILGMIYDFLPYMVLPIYTALKKIDNGMIEAAEDLGANPLRVVTRVVIPQTVPGILSGITMVFMPAVTTFAISYMLSNGTIYLTGDMIDEFFRGLNNRNAGSALSLVMMLLMLGSTLLLRRANPNQKGGKA